VVAEEEAPQPERRPERRNERRSEPRGRGGRGRGEQVVGMGDHMPSFIALSFDERRGGPQQPAEAAEAPDDTPESPEGEDAA
jgi:hypothetical protein